MSEQWGYKNRRRTNLLRERDCFVRHIRQEKRRKRRVFVTCIASWKRLIVGINDPEVVGLKMSHGHTNMT